MFRRAIALVLVALAGCSTTIDAADYDRNCKLPSDCRVIAIGDVCDCGCQSAAINASDYARYSDDRGNPDCSIDCGPCPAMIPVCTKGICEAQVAP